MLLLGLAAAGPVHAATRILVFGDSLSAAHGMPRDQGWVALLTNRLARRHQNIYVVNASISGETTAEGLARLPAVLRRTDPDIVLLELGGNDGLLALPVEAMQANLAQMIQRCRAAGARVLLLGMRIPSNYGPAYTERFHDAFDALARQTDVAYVPFFLAPIATDLSRFQADGIHPDAKAQPVLLAQIWPVLAPLLNGSRPIPAVP